MTRFGFRCVCRKISKQIRTLQAKLMLITEILVYHPDDRGELDDNANAEMRQLANLFTRRGLVKALSGFGKPDPFV
jgi:hypothetical protein